MSEENTTKTIALPTAAPKSAGASVVADEAACCSGLDNLSNQTLTPYQRRKQRAAQKQTELAKQRRDDRRADRIWRDSIRLGVAYHEVAHALAAVEVGIQIRGVHLAKRGVIRLFNGQVDKTPGSRGSIELVENIMDLIRTNPIQCIAVTLAGPAATDKYYKLRGWSKFSVSDGCASDIEYTGQAINRLLPEFQITGSEYVFDRIDRWKVWKQETVRSKSVP